MKRFIGVHTGEIMSGSGETVLTSDTNRACLVIVAHDPNKKIGCLAHALFFNNGFNGSHIPRVRSAEEAIDEMINEMITMGALPEEIEIRLVTGENVSHNSGDEFYQKTLAQTVELIKQKHLRVTDETLVDVGKKHVSFDIDSGAISYR